MTATLVNFQNAAGEQLSGSLELPADDPPSAFALFAHCFTCTKDYKAPVRISQALAGHGIATLRFDFPGLGRSEGQFVDTTLTKNVSDVVHAAAFLRQHYDAPRVLVGHSMGGAAVLRAAAELPDTRLVATLGTPAEPGLVGPVLAGARQQAERDGKAVIRVAGRTLELRRGFFDDVAGSTLADALANLSAALILFQAPEDSVVPRDNAERLYAAARHPKSLVALAGANHLVDRQQDAQLVADVIAAWCRRHLGPSGE